MQFQSFGSKMHTLLWIVITLLLCFKASYTNCESFELEHSVFKPELKEDCNITEFKYAVHQVVFDTLSCFSVWQHLKTYASHKCTEFWYKNKRYDNIGMKGPMQRAVVQYCKGTNSPTACFKCFNAAVDHIWYRNPCKTESYWANVSQCMRDYENNNFQWSRDLILNETKKVVTIDRNSNPYKFCGNRLADLGNYNSFEIQFPLHMPRVREEVEKEFDVILSLFLNAFENNNPNGKTLSDEGFRCEDFLKGGYLSRYYHSVIYPVIIPADDEVMKAYRTVREDMCNLTTNKVDCVTCYTEGDNKFMYYLKNNNTEIKSVVENFTEINTIHEKCHNQSNVPESYKKMLSKRHPGLDNLNMKCGNPFDYSFRDVKRSKSFCETTEENRKPIYEDKFAVVLQVMSFNFFSHLGYGLRHQVSGECPLVALKHLFCMMRVGKFISERLGDDLTETQADDAINEFTSLLSGGCPDAYKNN